MFRGRVPALTDPVALVAVAVVAVNDHVLKMAWHNAATGKISDVAGVVAMAVILGLLTRSRLVAAVITAGVFAALKLVPGVAEAAAPILGGVARRDPSDLIALVAVLPAIEYSSWRVGRPRQRGLAEAVAAALGAAAILTTASATSCLPAAEVTRVTAADGVTYAFVDATSETGGWYASDDAGESWSELPVDVPASVTRRKPPVLDVCGQGGCYRVRGQSLEAADSVDGPWSTMVSFGEDELRVARSGGYGCGGSAEFFLDLAIADRQDGERVVVAMGSQGVLVGSPSEGWTERAFGSVEPVDIEGQLQLGRRQSVGGVLLLVAVPVLSVGCALFGARRRRMWAVVAALGAGVAVAVGGLVAMGGALFFLADAPRLAGVVVIVISVAAASTATVIAYMAARLAGRQNNVSSSESMPRSSS